MYTSKALKKYLPMDVKPSVYTRLVTKDDHAAASTDGNLSL